MSTPWLLILLAWAHIGYLAFKPEHQWPAFASGLGLLGAVLVWGQRGTRFKARWFLCAWGAFECLQIFVCQMMQVWWVIPGPQGMCSAYTGFPFLWWCVWSLLVVVYWIAVGAAASGGKDG